MLLNSHLLNIMKQLLNLTVETCGSISIIDDKNVYLELQTTGKELPDKCTHLFYRPHIFHTHVLKNKSYPSTQDIIKVMKKHEIVSSLIVTHWGIWEICCPIKMKINEKDETNVRLFIQKQLNRLHSKKLDESLIYNVITTLETQYNKNFDFGFSIKFKNWTTLDKYNYMQSECKSKTK